jgi:hypothetical protein
MFQWKKHSLKKASLLLIMDYCSHKFKTLIKYVWLQQEVLFMKEKIAKSGTSGNARNFHYDRIDLIESPYIRKTIIDLSLRMEIVFVSNSGWLE